MKLIYPNNLSNAYWANPDNNFPGTRLLGENGKKPQRLAKSVLSSDTLTLWATSGDTLALFNCNATNINSITVREGGVGINWHNITWNNITWQEEITGSTPDHDITQLGFGVLWCEFAAQSSTFAVNITMSNSNGDALYVGAAVVGSRMEFADPDFGVKQSFRDYSIVKKYNSASRYTRKRDRTRTFSFTLMEDRDVDYYKYMETVWWNLGPDPIAWRLVSNGLTNKEWIVFAAYDGQMPQGSHDYPDDSVIVTNLEEVL